MTDCQHTGLPNTRTVTEVLAEDLLAAGLTRVDETLQLESREHFRDIEAKAKHKGLGLWAKP